MNFEIHSDMYRTNGTDGTEEIPGGPEKTATPQKTQPQMPDPRVLTEKDSVTVQPGQFKSAQEQYAALDDVVSATGKLLAEISKMAAQDRKMNKEAIRQQYETIEQTALSEAKKMQEGAVAQLVCGIVGSAVQIASGAFSIYSGSKALSSELKANSIQSPANKELTELDKLKADKISLEQNIKKMDADIVKYQKDVTTATKEIEHFTSTDKAYNDAKDALAEAKINKESADIEAHDLVAGNRSRHAITEGISQSASAAANITRTTGEYVEQEKRADIKKLEAKEASLRGAIEALKEINDSLKELQTKARDTIQDISRSENDATRKIVTV